uniref:uncharacterized protein LOC122598623 n=1 Tax=Erigeron canadensis TaxID=72917 RepID=UPI001CB8E8FC|nr:uncharacterized protein LOC122598623 [Erigeron canadensis]
MAAAPELVLIGFDNSAWMPRGSDNLNAQLDAFKYYCHTKFEVTFMLHNYYVIRIFDFFLTRTVCVCFLLQTNPGSFVGIFTMSESCYDECLFPSTDLEEIVDKAQGITTGCGNLDVQSALVFNAPSLRRWCPGLKKRILLFIGGTTNLDPTFVAEFSKILKDWSIVIDVVNFYPEDRLCVYSKYGYHFGKSDLQDLFAATNGDDGNSHFVQVTPGSSIPIEDYMSIFKKDPSEENS